MGEVPLYATRAAPHVLHPKPRTPTTNPQTLTPNPRTQTPQKQPEGFDPLIPKPPQKNLHHRPERDLVEVSDLGGRAPCLEGVPDVLDGVVGHAQVDLVLDLSEVEFESIRKMLV